ncbi:MAG: TIGR04222 domain-containing membrane protein, partial [Gordonia sp. (in: high G+C Gram-positive bacteria)]
MPASDTWGIPGPTFLALYAALAVAALGAALLVRFRRQGSHPNPDDTTALTVSPAEAGLLVSPRHAVLAALAQLRLAGVVDAGGRPARALTAHDQHSLDWFTRAVFDRLPTDPRSAAPGSMAEPLQRLRADLIGRGLI